MQIWLKNYEGTESLRLPVLPPSVDVSRDKNIEMVNLPAVGEVAMIGRGKLFGLTLSSFFPAQFYPFCDYSNFPTPASCIAMIERWAGSGKPIRLIITDTGINTLMAVEKFNYVYGKSKDVNFSLVLREYKVLQFTRVADSATGGGGSATSRPTPPAAQRTYTVVAGDTLYKIAKKFYQAGSVDNIRKIQNANKGLIKDVNKIQIGWKLVIPK